MNEQDYIPSICIVLTATLCHADNSRRAFYKEFVKVVEAADVIIEVLDARDPLATRCTDVERYVRKSGATKKLILLLNKIGRILTSCPVTSSCMTHLPAAPTSRTSAEPTELSSFTTLSSGMQGWTAGRHHDLLWTLIVIVRLGKWATCLNINYMFVL